MSFGMMEAMLSFLRRQVGLRDDAASSTGSAHAKLAYALNNLATILGKNIIANNTIVRSAGLYVVSVGGYYPSDNIIVNVSGQGIANIAKCMITVEGSAQAYGSTDSFEPYIYSASTSSIILKVYNRTASGEPETRFVSVRVLEFY